MADIMDAACGTYGLTSAEILSTRQTTRLVHIRRVLATAARRFGFSSVEIGASLGMGHDSIIHLWRKKADDAEVISLQRFARGCAERRLIDFATALGFTLPEIDGGQHG
jgi:hypothetical protein